MAGEQPPSMGQQLAETFNERRQTEAQEAQQSALKVLLDMPYKGKATEEALDYLIARWDDLLRVGEHLVKTRFVNRSYKTAAEVAMALSLGRGLRIDPNCALNNIYVVNNKPALESKLMAGLVYREHGGEAIHYVEIGTRQCVIDLKRKDQAQYQRFTFTWADAERAGLIKDTYNKYPQFMLRHRCISMALNAVFPDVTLGLITPEELGAPVKVDSQTGDVTVDQDALAKAKPPVPPATEAADQPHGPLPVGEDHQAVVTRLEPEEKWVQVGKMFGKFAKLRWPDGTIVTVHTFSNPKEHKWGVDSFVSFHCDEEKRFEKSGEFFYEISKVRLVKQKPADETEPPAQEAPAAPADETSPDAIALLRRDCLRLQEKLNKIDVEITNHAFSKAEFLGSVKTCDDGHKLSRLVSELREAERQHCPPEPADDPESPF